MAEGNVRKGIFEGLIYIPPPGCGPTYEGVSESFWTGCLE